jgi:CBS domain-containing protein
MAQTISEVMMPSPVTVQADEPIQGAASVMREQGVGDLIVVDGQEVRGIVTDRDLVVRGLAAGHDPTTTPVGGMCSEELAVVDADADVDQAVAIMRDRALRRLPVVAEGRLVGIVSIGDLAISQDPKSALADISAAPPNK